MTKRQPYHIVIEYDEPSPFIRCMNCGFQQELKLPAAINDLVALEKILRKAHRDCKPREQRS